MQAFQVAALALPVSNRVIDELELAHAAKIGNRKNGTEYSLQTGVFTLIREQFHLQKTLIRTLLNLDQIRNRDGSFDFREINSLGGPRRCGFASLTP